MAPPDEKCKQPLPKKGMEIKATPEGQTETRQEHMVSKKHYIGHKELYWIKRLVAHIFGETDPVKVCDRLGKDQVCIEAVHPHSNRRYHIEFDRKGIINAWVPTQKCRKDHCFLENEGYGYAAYNPRSKRFQYKSGKMKGKFAKGTLGEPKGLVTNNKKRNNWENPRTSSPKKSPFLKKRKSFSSQSNKKRFGSQGDKKDSHDPVQKRALFRFILSNVIRRTANFLHDRNIHNLDAGGKEIWDGAPTCAKSAVMDELTHGFVTAMQRRGYPTKSISMAVNMVLKPLGRAYQAGGEHGFMHALEDGLNDWLHLAQKQATQRPLAFVADCVNTVAPLLGSYLNVQWSDSYKGLRVFGYGLGVGTQVDSGQNGFVADTGVHGSYRFRSILNTAGACLSYAGKECNVVASVEKHELCAMRRDIVTG